MRGDEYFGETAGLFFLNPYRIKMSNDELSEPDQRSATPSRRGPGTVFWVFLTLVVAGLMVYFSWLWMAKRAVDSAKAVVIEIADVFRPDLVITTFNEWRELKVTASGGNILEIATAESSEHFTRTTNMAMFGKVLPLTTTISEITIPATYRFHIDLNESWTISPDGNRLLVRAPAVKPSLPVAFDTGGVQKKTTTGWVRWDTAGDMEALEKEITGKLAERAGQPETLAKIRTKDVSRWRSLSGNGSSNRKPGRRASSTKSWSFSKGRSVKRFRFRPCRRHFHSSLRRSFRKRLT
jgi:hypothetical protein